MEQKSQGRPRSEKSRVAVLQATAGLLTDGDFQDLTVEGIAAAAGVGKQTIYRWWGSKAEVVVEAMAEGFIQAPLDSPEDTGDLRSDLQRWLSTLQGELEAPDVTRLVQAIMSALTSASETSAAIHATLIQPIMDGLDERFGAHEARHPGDLPGPASFLAETVGAALLLNVLFNRPLTDEWRGQLLDLVTPAT